jgi:hypothetical protein
MLEEGNIYIVKVNSGNVWLFKKYKGMYNCDKQTGCSRSLCLTDMYRSVEESYICRNNEIVWIKPANENYLAIWNRVFNDNVELR